MRIKNYTKLLKLRLIKTNIYRKKFALNWFKVEKIEYQLKKAFQIIYKYHINRKKILFLNSSYLEKITNILKDTDHTFITQYEWMGGILTNKAYIKPTKGQKSKNMYDLLVILNLSFSEDLLKENFKTKIPIIVFHSEFPLISQFFKYSVFGEFSFEKEKIKENFFLNLLKLILQKRKFK